MNQPLDPARLAAIARENGDHSLARFLDQHVERAPDLPEWIQREAEEVRRARRWAAIRHWLFVGTLGVIILALLAWCLAAWPQLLAAEHPQPVWHDPRYDASSSAAVGDQDAPVAP